MNLVCTASNSIRYSADHSVKSFLMNTLAQRDTLIHKMDKDLPQSTRQALRSAPLTSNTLFAGQVDDALEELQKIKQSKDRPISISLKSSDFGF